MIAVDTSALMAIIMREPAAQTCADALTSDNEPLISAGTLTEALIVAGRRRVAEEMVRLVEGFGLRVVNVTPAVARRAADAYSRWGRGVHPAALNFGDCFSYEVAKEHSCPLLFVGSDFPQTDIQSAL